ncbi:polysaccharide biosynthesis/export family protein [Paraflavisolibacter sp. H34]|uniref:polysaccharide biosynthesis/export family protein n=1 Tax=Huijunlia imazamoxiresistens TaxID=3127457 RepID=UPI003018DAE7
MRVTLLLLIGLGLLLGSCKTPRLVYNYLEDFKDTTTRKSYFIAEPVIQANDLLSVQISSSSLDPEVDQLFNQRLGGGGGGGGNSPLRGYLVDQKGNLELPRLGPIHAAGLTKSQLVTTIKAKLAGQLSDPTVIVRFMNFRFVVIGEVGSPGVHTVEVENMTLLEALAMSGDILITGKKKEVKILREKNGQRQLGIVDVTSSKLFESPYFQLQQNDVILVEKTKYSITTTEQSRVRQQMAFALSIATAVGLLISLLK